MPTVKELREEYVDKLKDLRGIAAKAEDENRDFTAEERQEIVRRTDELKQLKARVDEKQGDSDLVAAMKALGDDIGPAPSGNGNGSAVVDMSRIDGRPGKGKSVGERFVSSPEFKGFLEQFPNGRIPEKAKGLISPPVQFKDIISGSEDDRAGAFVQTDYTGIYETLGRRDFTLLDAVSVRQTGSDNVEYVRQVTQSNAATPVPEATGTSGGVTGGDVAGTKPESDFTFLKVNEPVKTVAVWTPTTKRALSDSSQLMGLIDDELRSDLDQELEDQIMTGDGTGENFTGILNTSGVQSQAWDTNLFATTRQARTKVRTVGRARASAYLFHPNDWERIDLETNSQGDYYYGGPAAPGPEMHWKLPVIISEAITEGVGLVGDFSKAVLWDREQTTIQVSDSHADFFIRNLVAVLAELRAAFGVTKPTAFVQIDLTAA